MTPQRSKEIGIIVFALLYSGVVFGLTSLFVVQDRFMMTPVLVFLGILALIWVALTAISLAVLQQPGSSAILMAGIAVILAGAGLFHLQALIAAGVSLPFLALARRSFYREINNRVLFRVSEAFGPGLRFLLFAVGIAALGLAWPSFEGKLNGTQVILSPEHVSVLVNKIVPSLPAQIRAFVDINQLTILVTNTINQTLQSLIVSYHWIFLLIVLFLAISAWRAIMPVAAWVILPVILGLIYLARRANLMYLSRSQATIERLHL